MNICQGHWDRLRELIEERDLGHLASQGGPVAAARLRDEVERGERTVANFDPLMAAFFAIGTNAMDYISRAGGSPLYLMAPPGTPEDPVELAGGEGRTWPRCGLCYLNLAHELTCTEPRCTLDKQRGYDWMLERAADDAKGEWERLRAKALEVDG